MLNSAKNATVLKSLSKDVATVVRGPGDEWITRRKDVIDDGLGFSIVDYTFGSRGPSSYFDAEMISSSEMEDLSHIPRNIPSGMSNKLAGVSNS